MSPDNTPQGLPGGSDTRQGKLASDAIEVQQTEDGGVALAFVSQSQPPQAGQEPTPGNEPTVIRGRARFSAEDAALVAYVDGYNHQHPERPITFAEASQQIRFAQQQAAEAPQPPVDFAARQAQIANARTETLKARAEARENDDTGRADELTDYLATLELDARETRQDEARWHAEESNRARQAQTDSLSSAHGSDFERIAAQYPMLKDPNHPVTVAFNQNWEALGNDPLLNSPSAPTHVMNSVLAQMGAQAQRPGLPQNPALRGGFTPQAPMYPVTPMGAPYQGMTRNAPSAPTMDQIAAKLEAGELTDAQLDKIMAARPIDAPARASRFG